MLNHPFDFSDCSGGAASVIKAQFFRYVLLRVVLVRCSGLLRRKRSLACGLSLAFQKRLNISYCVNNRILPVWTCFREWIRSLWFPEVNIDGASALPPRTVRASNPMRWLGNPWHLEIRMQPVCRLGHILWCLIPIHIFLCCNRDKKIKKEKK